MGIRTRRARAHSKTHFVGFSLAGLLGFIALLCVALAVSLGALVTTWLQDLPDYTSADAFLVAEPTRVYDADGNEIVAYYLQNRRSVELDQISDYVQAGHGRHRGRALLRPTTASTPRASCAPWWCSSRAAPRVARPSPSSW